jgi:hypothetical protein
MSKKYKGKICVYCASRESTAPDHVIAREFFPESQRANLPKVPSCDVCNGKKATLEHYATTLFPFGSLHQSAKNMLKDTAPKRLARNLKLKRELQGKMDRIWLKSSSGLILPTMTLPIKGEKLIQLFSMIIRGLYWHNWNSIIPSDYFVEIYSLNLRGLIFFQDNLLSKAPANLRGEIFSDGVFQYRCTRGDEDPYISVWEMSFYNGIMMTGGSNEPLFFFGLTGPEKDRNAISLRSKSES